MICARMCLIKFIGSGVSKEKHVSRSSLCVSFYVQAVVRERRKSAVEKYVKIKERSVRDLSFCEVGWKTGLEPATFGTTIRHSNQLSYIHHICVILTRCKDRYILLSGKLSGHIF